MAAEWVVDRARRALEARGRFSLVLSGGSTPGALFELLASSEWRSRIDWRRVHCFWADERCVPPDDPESNYALARQSLLRHVPLPAANVHRVLGELSAERAAEAYERELKDYFGAAAVQFDAVLLGMGEDGHTASLFPDDPALDEGEWLVVPVWAPKRPPPERVTLTLPALRSARSIAVLVTGAGKAERLAAVLAGGEDYPIRRVIDGLDDATFFVDEAAAARLNRSM